MHEINKMEQLNHEFEYNIENLTKDAQRYLDLNVLKKQLCIICKNVLAKALPHMFDEISPQKKASHRNFKKSQKRYASVLCFS